MERSDVDILNKYLKDQRMQVPALAEMLNITPQAVYKQMRQEEFSISFVEKLESHGIDIFKPKINHQKAKAAAGTRPYYDIDASAGNALVFNDKSEVPAAMVSFPGFQDVDFWINVFGDSMYPKYSAGEVIACKEMDKSLVPFGEAFLVMLRDGNRYIKYVRKNTKHDRWSLLSENEKYDAFDVKIDDVKKVWIIKGKMKRNLI